MLKIIHITDLHLDDDLTKSMNLNARKNFNLIIKEIKKIKPDAIIIGGDLGDKKSLRWLKNQLDKLKINYFLVLGNHDKLTEVNKIFNLKNKIKNGKLCYNFKIKKSDIIILDSSDDTVSTEQLDFLNEACKKTKKEIMLFIHHPPLKCSCRLMDENFALKNSQEVMNVLTKILNIKHIFCGHYHSGKTIKKNKKFFHLTPSTICQIDEKSEKLEISSILPGYRIIDQNESELKTSYNYQS